MRTLVLYTGLALAGGCAPVNQQQVREYNEDGVHLFHKGSYSEARACFAAALALQPHDPDLLYNLAQCHDKLGQTARAEQTYRECLQLAPNHPEAWHALTVLLVNTNRRDLAASQVRDWMAREPDLGAPHAEHAWLLALEGDLINLRGRLQEALARDPRNNLANLELARYYEKHDRKDRALILYERALELNPHQPDIVQCVSRLRAEGVGKPKPD
jgi:Tfp pilus assembly protein PilF